MRYLIPILFLIGCSGVVEPGIKVAEKTHITFIEYDGKTIIEWYGMESKVIKSDVAIIGKFKRQISVDDQNRIIVDKNIKWDGLDVDIFSARVGTVIVFNDELPF